MLELRYYQREAIDSIYKYFELGNTGNPGIVLPTGTGKSLVMAKFIEEATASWPDTRIIVSTHVKELVEQDYLEFIELCPFANAGIYSAGLKRRDTDNQILFAGIQSVYKKAYELQRCDLLIIDEAHTVPPEGEGRWRTFIDDMLKINPDMKIIWLTATDYRMTTGLLTDGDIFTDVCYEYPLLQAIKDGYLAPVVPKNMATKYDLSNVGIRGGEYIAGELEKAFDIDEKTKAALDEVEAYGATRKKWLIFAAGNQHAEHIHIELQRRGYLGVCVTQDTPNHIRDKAVEDLRAGLIKYIVNNRIFTTGFNDKGIDLIADFGGTKSPGIHVQKMGRGMRCLGIDIHESILNGKSDCLVLDFAGNIVFHGPLDQIKGRSKKKGVGGDAPVKVCPECAELCFAGIRVCFNCGHQFPQPEIKIRSSSYDAPILSSQIEPEWLEVLNVDYGFHQKEGKPPTLRVTYTTAGKQVREWVCFGHTNEFARGKAAKWHKVRHPNHPVPSDVNMALEYVYPAPYRISVIPDGKWDRIVAYDWNKPTTIEKDTEEYEIPY